MQVDVLIPGADRIESLGAHVRRRLLSRVGQAAGRVRRATVRFHERCGHARGVILTACRMEADVASLAEPIVFEALASNPYLAADEAIERLGAVLDRAVLHREPAPLEVAHPRPCTAARVEA